MAAEAAVKRLFIRVDEDGKTHLYSRVVQEPFPPNHYLFSIQKHLLLGDDNFAVKVLNPLENPYIETGVKTGIWNGYTIKIWAAAARGELPFFLFMGLDNWRRTRDGLMNGEGTSIDVTEWVIWRHPVDKTATNRWSSTNPLPGLTAELAYQILTRVIEGRTRVHPVGVDRYGIEDHIQWEFEYKAVYCAIFDMGVRAAQAGNEVRNMPLSALLHGTVFEAENGLVNTFRANQSDYIPSWVIAECIRALLSSDDEERKRLFANFLFGAAVERAKIGPFKSFQPERYPGELPEHTPIYHNRRLEEDVLYGDRSLAEYYAEQNGPPPVMPTEDKEEEAKAALKRPFEEKNPFMVQERDPKMQRVKEDTESERDEDNDAVMKDAIATADASSPDPMDARQASLLERRGREDDALVDDRTRKLQKKAGDERMLDPIEEDEPMGAPLDKSYSGRPLAPPAYQAPSPPVDAAGAAPAFADPASTLQQQTQKQEQKPDALDAVSTPKVTAENPVKPKTYRRPVDAPYQRGAGVPIQRPQQIVTESVAPNPFADMPPLEAGTPPERKDDPPRPSVTRKKRKVPVPKHAPKPEVPKKEEPKPEPKPEVPKKEEPKPESKPEPVKKEKKENERPQLIPIVEVPFNPKKPGPDDPYDIEEHPADPPSPPSSDDDKHNTPKKPPKKKDPPMPDEKNPYDIDDHPAGGDDDPSSSSSSSSSSDNDDDDPCAELKAENRRLKGQLEELMKHHVQHLNDVRDLLTGALQANEGLVLPQPLERVEHGRIGAIKAVQEGLREEVYQTNWYVRSAWTQTNRALSAQHLNLLRTNDVRRAVVVDALLTDIVTRMQGQFQPLYDANREQLNDLRTQFNLLHDAIHHPVNRDQYDSDIKTRVDAVRKELDKLPKPSAEDTADKREIARLKQQLMALEQERRDEAKRLDRWIEESKLIVSEPDGAAGRRGVDPLTMRTRAANLTETLQRARAELKVDLNTYLPRSKPVKESDAVPNNVFDIVALQEELIKYMYQMLQQVPRQAADLRVDTFITPNERTEFVDRWNAYMNRTRNIWATLIGNNNNFDVRVKALRDWMVQVAAAKDFKTVDELIGHADEYKRLRRDRKRMQTAFTRLSFWCKLVRQQMHQLLFWHDAPEPDPTDAYIEQLGHNLPRAQMDNDMIVALQRQVRQSLEEFGELLGDAPATQQNVAYLRRFVNNDPDILTELRAVWTNISDPENNQAMDFIRQSLNRNLGHAVAHGMMITTLFTRYIFDAFASSFEQVGAMRTVALANSTEVASVVKKVRGFIEETDRKVEAVLDKVQKRLGRLAVGFEICSRVAVTAAATRALAWAPRPRDFLQIMSVKTIETLYGGVPASEDDRERMRRISAIDVALFEEYHHYGAPVNVDDEKYHAMSTDQIQRLKRDRLTLIDNMDTPALRNLYLDEQGQRLLFTVMQRLHDHYRDFLATPPWSDVVDATVKTVNDYMASIDIPTRAALQDNATKALESSEIIATSLEYKQLRQYIYRHHKEDQKQDRRQVDDIPLDEYQRWIHEWFTHRGAAGGGGELGRALGNLVQANPRNQPAGNGALQPVDFSIWGTPTYRAFFTLAVMTAGEAGLTVYDVLAVNHAASSGRDVLDDTQRKLAYIAEVNNALVTLRRSTKDSTDVIALLQQIADKTQEVNMRELQMRADREAASFFDNLLNDQLTQMLIVVYTPLMYSAMTSCLGYISRTSAGQKLGARSLHALVAGSAETRRLFASMCAAEIRLNLIQAGTAKVGPNIMQFLVAKMRQLQFVFKSQLEHQGGERVVIKLM